MKTCVIADIHGKLDMLKSAADAIPPGAKVICLGDYIDRGPDSAGVIKFLRARPEWVCLKGNHEDMMVNAMTSNEAASGWLTNGGGATLASYGISEDMQPDVDWMKALPTIHEDALRTYVHAEADSDVKLRLWGRYRDRDEAFWPKYVVHGHTPVRKPVILSTRTNLDTGAVFGGALSVGVFDDDTPGGPVQVISIRGER